METSKNYTTVYFYNVFITAYSYSLVHLGMSFHILYVYQKVFVIKFEKLVNTCSKNNNN